MIDIPLWFEVDAMKERGTDLNPLEKFVHSNEPAGDYDSEWRSDLQNMLEFVVKAND